MTFGERMQKARRSAGMGVREAARGLGISSAYVSDIENSQRSPLSPRSIRKFAELVMKARVDVGIVESIETLERDLYDLAREEVIAAAITRWERPER